MIKDQLNLQGNSLADVIFKRDNAEQFLIDTVQKLIDGYYPGLTGWLAKQKIAEKAHECKTVEELEKLTYDIIPDNCFEEISGMVDAIPELDNDIQRTFIMTEVSRSVVRAAKQFCDNIMLQRAQRLYAEKPKIIT